MQTSRIPMTRQDRYPTSYPVLRHGCTRGRHLQLFLIQNCPWSHTFPDIFISMGSSKQDVLQLRRGELLKCLRGFAGVGTRQGWPQRLRVPVRKRTSLWGGPRPSRALGSWRPVLLWCWRWWVGRDGQTDCPGGCGQGGQGSAEAIKAY